MNAEDKELRTRAKNPDKLREAARTHRPVTRSVAKKAADAKHLRA